MQTKPIYHVVLEEWVPSPHFPEKRGRFVQRFSIRVHADSTQQAFDEFNAKFPQYCPTMWNLRPSITPHAQFRVAYFPEQAPGQSAGVYKKIQYTLAIHLTAAQRLQTVKRSHRAIA